MRAFLQDDWRERWSFLSMLHCGLVITGLTLASAAFTNSWRSYLVKPDRAKNCEQPPVNACSGDKLIGALDGAQAGGLHEVVSRITRLRQHERISPKTRERRLQPGPHFQSARFAHGPARVHRSHH